MVAVFQGIAVDIGVCLSEAVIGTLVVDADGLGRRQNTEADPFVADPIFVTAQSYRNLSPKRRVKGYILKKSSTTRLKSFASSYRPWPHWAYM